MQIKVINIFNNKTLFFASIEDITERKELEYELSEQRKFFERIYDTIPCGIAQLTIDKGWRFLNANLTMIKMLGFQSKTELWNQTRYLENYICEEYRKEVSEKATNYFRTGNQNPLNFKYSIQGIDGKISWVNDSSQIIEVADNPILQSVFTDISAMKDEHDSLVEEARKDSLTGLYTRRAFEEKVIDKFQDNSSQNVIHAFMMIDIDNFKDINDEFGHLSGDQALIEATKIIRRNLRNQDIVARFGGDEFVVF